MLNLSANPHYYDYLHSIRLCPSKINENEGKIELVDGGGQCVSFEGFGDYKIENNDIMSYLYVYNLKKKNYDDSYSDLADFKVAFKIVNELSFLKMYSYAWEDRSHLGVTYNVIPKKYVFEYDPLRIAQSKRINNLYFNLESTDNENIYFNTDDENIMPLDKIYQMYPQFNKKHWHVTEISRLNDNEKGKLLNSLGRILQNEDITKINTINNHIQTLSNDSTLNNKIFCEMYCDGFYDGYDIKDVCIGVSCSIRIGKDIKLNFCVPLIIKTIDEANRNTLIDNLIKMTERISYGDEMYLLINKNMHAEEIKIDDYNLHITELKDNTSKCIIEMSKIGIDCENMTLVRVSENKN